MTTPDSIRALRGTNPRAAESFAGLVDATAEAMSRRLASHEALRSHPPRRARLVPLSLAGAALAAVALTITLALGSPGSGVENATAAVREAASVTAASAEQSGTAVVRVTHGGELWAGKTIVWNGDDVSVTRDAPPGTRRPWVELLVVDGILYGIDPAEGGWVKFGNPSSIDPDSGTTPAEHLAAVREDVGGTTLRRIIRGAGGLTTRRLSDGSTVYTGSVAAGLVARETGFKEGSAIRVLPFGYVAHDEAADAASLLDLAVTVGADDVVRELRVSWGSGSSEWTYTVAYSLLGTTPAPVAPATARDLLAERSLPR